MNFLMQNIVNFSQNIMDFRQKNLKQKHLNYNSVSEFPRSFPFYQQNEDRISQPKIKEFSFDMPSPLPFLRNGKQNNNNSNLLISKIELLESRVEALENTNYRSNSVHNSLSKKIQNLRENRYSIATVNPTLQDFTLFKQNMQNDLISNKEELKGFSTKYQQMQMRQNRMEQELRQWLNEQRQEVSMKLMTQNEQLRGQEFSKQMRNDHQFQTLKGTIETVQQKFSEEREKKLKEDALTRQLIQRQIAFAKEDLLKIAKRQKQQSVKITRELKEAFSSLKSLLDTDREQIREAINEVQRVSDARNSKLQKNIETINLNAIERSSKLEKKIADQKSEWISFKVRLEEKYEQNRAVVMNYESRALERIEKQQFEPGSEKMQDFKEEMKEWKQLNQQKNLNVFREMSNALKTMRLELKEEQDDANKQIAELSKIVKNLKKNITKQVKNDLQEVTNILTEEFDLLTQEIEQTNEMIAIAKKEMDQKIEQNLTKGVDEFKVMVNNISEQSKKVVEEANKKRIDLESAMRSSLEQAKKKAQDDLAKVQKSQQQKLDTFIATLNQQNEQWTSSLNQTITGIKNNLTKKIEQTNDIQTKTLEEQIKKIDVRFTAVNADFSKKIDLTSSTLKKTIEQGLSNERNLTSKQISKTTEQIMNLITQSNIKTKKEREIVDKSITQNIEQSKKTNKVQLVALKTAIEAKVNELKVKQSEKSVDQQKRLAELKSYLEQSLTRHEKLIGEQLSKGTKRVDKIEAATGTLKKELLTEVEKVTKGLPAQTKSKVDELKAKQLQFQKKVSETIEKTKKQLSSEIQSTMKSNSDSKAKEEQLKSKLLQFQKRFIDSLGKMKSELTGELSKSKTAMTEENKKMKNQLQIKLKTLEEVKAKKQQELKGKQQELKSKQNDFLNKTVQFEKRMEQSHIGLKKQLQKSFSDEIAKTNNSVELKIQLVRKQIEARPKETESDKKIQGLITTIKKQFEGELIKERKLTNDRFVKLQEENKKNRADLDSKAKNHSQNSAKLASEFAAKLDATTAQQLALKQEMARKMAEIKGIITVATKAQEAQFNKLQDQRLQHLKAELSEDTSSKIDQLKAESSTLQLIVSETTKQTKQLLNKLQASSFSEREKNKSMYMKLTSDIVEIADDLTLIMSEMKISK